MDKIIIRDLELRTIIGTLAPERQRKQKLLFQVELSGDFRQAGASDDFLDTFDYSAIEEKIVRFVENSSFHLLEALAENTARICLEEPLIHAVKIRIDKPGAPRYARCISIEICRTKP